MWDLQTNRVNCLSHEMIEEEIHIEKNFTLLKQGTKDCMRMEGGLQPIALFV